MKTQMITTTTAEKLKRATFNLRFDAYWMRNGAEAAVQCSLCEKHTPEKRKSYARQARKEFKQASDLYAQAAATCQAWLDVDNEKGVRWWYRFLPAAFNARAQACNASAKEVLADAKLIK